MRHLGLVRLEGDGGDLAAQVAARQLVEHVVAVLRGQHDHLDVAGDRVAQAA